MKRLNAFLAALVLLSGIAGCNGGCAPASPANKQDLKGPPSPKARPY